MRIEIVTTPNGNLSESGFGGLAACWEFLEATSAMGHRARLNVCRNCDDLDRVAACAPDLVILAVKYLVLDNGTLLWLSDYFGKKGINHSGSSRAALEYDSDKELAKSILTDAGLETAQAFLVTRGQFCCEEELSLSFPLFLKPIAEANGNGIDDLSFVTDFPEFERKVSSLHESRYTPVLAEDYLDGREFTVAIISTSDGGLLVSCVEILPKESETGLKSLGCQAKRDNLEMLCRAKVGKLTTRVKELAVRAFLLFGARDLGRVDVKTDLMGRCHFLEINLVPGMTFGSSYFPEACRIDNGLSYGTMVSLIVEAGLARASSLTAGQPHFVPSLLFGPS